MLTFFQEVNCKVNFVLQKNRITHKLKKYQSQYISINNVLSLGLFLCSKRKICAITAVSGIIKIKGVGQALYTFQLCQKDKIPLFLTDLQLLLETIGVQPHTSYHERKFLRGVRNWLYVFACFLVSYVIMTATLVAYGSNQLDWVRKAAFQPFPQVPAIYVFKFTTDFFAFTAWFLPVAMCSVLMKSLRFIFHEYLDHLSTQSLALNTSIKEIRQKYLLLTNLSGRLDDILNGLLMVSFLCDMAVICVGLWTGIYTIDTAWIRIAVLSILLLPLSAMLTLSRDASQLYGKVLKILKSLAVVFFI